MKILIINSLYHPYKIGGAEVSVQLLAEQLAKSGHLVRVVCLTEENRTRMDCINGVDVNYIPLFNVYWPFYQAKRSSIKKLLWHVIDSYNFVMAKRVGQLIDDFKPDVVHTNNLAGFSVSVWSEVKRRKIKLVHTSRDYYLFHPNSTMFKNGRNQDVNSLEIKCWSYLKKVMSKHVDSYVGISHYIEQLHSNNGSFKNAHKAVIYNPVEQLGTKNDKNESRDVNVIRIGFIGRLSEEKGFDDFIALARKFSNDPRYEFYAAGRFPSDANGKMYQNESERVKIHYLGFVKPAEFYTTIDVVYLPIKWNEPFGRVVIESVMAGKLTFTNMVGGIKELATVIDYIKPIDIAYDLIISGAVSDFPLYRLSDEQKLMFSINNIMIDYCSKFEADYEFSR